MANTIRIGTFEVSSFKVGLKDPKIYLGDILLYPTGGYKVCYAVVDDITQYSETEFEDVYDKATEKWYKLNNLNQYEEYGVYGSGRNITYYDGKLTIDSGYEYQYSGNSWVNVGEVSGGSRVPAGYKEVEYIQNTGTSYINTNFKPNQDTRIVCTMQCVTSSSYGRYFGAGGYNTANAMQFDYESGAQGTLHISWGHIAGWTIYSSCVGDYNVHTYDWDKNYFYRDKGETNQFSASTTYTAFQCVANLGIFCHINDNGTAASSQGECMVGKMYSFQIYDNGTLVRDFVPCKRDSDSKYGVYDVVNNTFYSSANSTALSGGSETGSTEYPKYYSEKSEPLDNLTFNTMAEAQAYAEANCVYDGMHATIDGDRYYFDSTDENGWVNVSNYLRFIAKGNGTFTFTPKTGVAAGNVISYSLDSGSTWTSANTTSTVQSGDVVFIKGENFGISSNQGIGTFSSTVNFDAEGNAMSLLYGDNFENQTSLSGKDYAFMNLFSGCTTIINAENLVLPATTLSNYCYCNMFNRAFNLIKAPSELPATTLGDACYMNMFYNCGAMTTVMDELPATTLAASAYSQMFIACSGFTTAPILPAAVITTYGYYRMFYNAKKVNSITCLALDKTAANSVGSWVTGVASSGTFTKHKDMTSWSRGNNGIPNNWTVVDYSG